MKENTPEFAAAHSRYLDPPDEDVDDTVDAVVDESEIELRARGVMDDAAILLSYVKDSDSVLAPHYSYLVGLHQAATAIYLGNGIIDELQETLGELQEKYIERKKK